jgi:geranylgeranyl transferase type-1 subunit beta
MRALFAPGGTSYCAIASLHLAGRLQSLPRSERTLDWLVHRQVPLEAHMLDGEDVSSESDPEGDAFLRDLVDGKREVVGCQGRPEKLPDACYSFWVGGSIEVGPLMRCVADVGHIHIDLTCTCTHSSLHHIGRTWKRQKGE